jgi:hypothetical protein
MINESRLQSGSSIGTVTLAQQPMVTHGVEDAGASVE